MKLFVFISSVATLLAFQSTVVIGQIKNVALEFGQSKSDREIKDISKYAVINSENPEGLTEQRNPSRESVENTTTPNWITKNPSELVSKADLDTLKQVQLIHRHGDRTPIRFPLKDPLRVDPIWDFYGQGQLTNRGKARLFLLGSIMRYRYDEFLNKSINKNICLSRSSGSLRCIESAQVFLSSFLGIDQASKSKDADLMVWSKTSRLAHLWQPAHIQSVPSVIDGLLAESSVCNLLEDEYLYEINRSPEAKALFKTYAKERELLRKYLGYDMTKFMEWFWASSQLEVELSYFPSKVNPILADAFPRVEKAGHKAMTLLQSTDTSRRLRAGLLVNEFIEQMRSTQNYRDGSDTIAVNEPKKFVHYSSHDINLIYLLGIFENWMKFESRPGYASTLILELHNDQTNDEWFVKFFYMPQVPHKLIELHIKSCEDGHPNKRCSLDKFEEIMQKYRIPSWQRWMSACQNNLYDVDPYELSL